MVVASAMLFYSLIFTPMTINAATFPTLSRPRRLTIDLILTPSALHIIIRMRIMWTAFKQSHNSQSWTPAAPFYGFIATLAEIVPHN
ncbi:hypothetical protein WN944_018868 [Citrus x changshan-huyou]|uniref:Uncharacterized protein n=1 Tax=Citrus x changshan-huyou TaxID=2935761 RepID=A0AAP0QF93_9ROSI